MNFINNQNGIIIDGENKVVVRNGNNVSIPSYIKGKNITTIDQNVYVDGYELLDSGEWKRTLKAFWHKLF